MGVENDVVVMKKFVGVRSRRGGRVAPDIRQITFGIRRNGGVDHVFLTQPDAQEVAIQAGVKFCNAGICVLFCRRKEMDSQAILEQGDCTGAQVSGKEPRLSVTAEVNIGIYEASNVPCKS